MRPIRTLMLLGTCAAMMGARPAFAQEFTGTTGFPSAAHEVDYGPTEQNPGLVAVDGSSGAATSTLSFQLIHARGGSQPRLGLHYRSTDDDGDAGLGWSYGIPVIEVSRVSGEENSIFYYQGQVLSFVCTVGSSSTCPPTGETTPSWASGWSYFRLKYDALGARFFLSPNSKTWRVELKSGETLELGAALTTGNEGSSSSNDSLDTDGGNAGPFRWNLVRSWDSQKIAANGTSNNVVQYVWSKTPEGCGGTPSVGYLTDIYDTPPDAGAATTAYAHHVRLTYESPGYAFVTVKELSVEYAVRQCRVKQVDMASFPFAGGSSREVIRRYHLGYSEQLHHSLLTSFQLEGACDPRVVEIGLDAPACSKPTLMPATTMSYTSPVPATFPGLTVPATLYNSGGGILDGNLIGTEISATLFDVNADGRPDIIVSTPDVQTAYLNTPASGGGWNLTQWQLQFHSGPLDPFAATATTLLGLPNSGGLASHTLAGDWWGDGKTQALFQQHRTPAANCYVYEPTYFQATSVPPGSCDPLTAGAVALGCWYFWDKLSDGPCPPPYTIIGDFNGDGLLDTAGPAAESASTIYSSRGVNPFNWPPLPVAGVPSSPFFSLFDGGIDAGSTTSPNGPTLAADMNGDGLDDYVIASFSGGTATVTYSPSGRQPMNGNAFGDWVEMAPFAPNPGPGFVTVWGPPSALPSNGPWLHDLNGDGLADLVVLLEQTGGGPSGGFGFGVFWNMDGTAFDMAHPTIVAAIRSTETNTPLSVLFGDVDGTGIDDLVYTDGAKFYFITFEYARTGSPAARPGVLASISNGFGVTTSVAYQTTTTPKPVAIVSSVQTVAQEKGSATRNWTQDYAYSSPVYDGWSHRVRGFENVIVRTTSNTDAGAVNHTSRQTHYVAVECLDTGGVCTHANVLQDGPRFFPPLPVTIDDYGDTLGIEAEPRPASAAHEVHRATIHVSWQANPIDSSAAWVVFPQQVDTYLYDVGEAPAAHTVSGPGLTVGSPGAGGHVVPTHYPVYGTKGTKHLVQTQAVDDFGNLTSTSDEGDPSEDHAIAWTANYEIASGTDWAWRMSTETTMAFPATSDDPILYSRSYSYSYDAQGNLTDVTSPYKSPLSKLARQDLIGTPPVAYPVAPDPGSASISGSTVTLVHFEYDATGYGNPTQVRRPNAITASAPDRCRAIGYDPQFNQLPTTESDFIGGCGSAALKTTIVMYDRGLAEVLQRFDPNVTLTSYTYDAFGRVASITAPDPNTPMMAGTTTLQAQYFDVPGFVRRQTVTTPAGVRHIYMDGTNEVMLRLDQADPSQGDGGAWVASGWRDLTHQDSKIVQYDPINGVANEAKVGYQSLTPTIAGQIAKDAELLGTGQVSGVTWHFFQSPVTGLGGPSGPLLQALEQAGIDVVIH